MGWRVHLLGHSESHQNYFLRNAGRVTPSCIFSTARPRAWAPVFRVSFHYTIFLSDLSIGRLHKDFPKTLCILSIDFSGVILYNRYCQEGIQREVATNLTARTSSKKSEKNRKNLLTDTKPCGIIRVSGEGSKPQSLSQGNLRSGAQHFMVRPSASEAKKKFAKPLDKQLNRCYNKSVLRDKKKRKR